MSKHLLRVLLVVVSIASLGWWAGVGAAAPTVKGSGKLAREVRATPAFTKLELDGAIEVDVRVGPKLRVELSADDDVLPLLRTNVDQGTLRIDLRAQRGPTVKMTSPVRAVITMPALAAVSVDGACTAVVQGVHADVFGLAVGGASVVTVSGAADQVGVAVHGAGRVLGEQLRVKQAAVSAKGASKLELTVAEALTISASGTAAVEIYGKPTSVTRAISGASSLTLR